MPKPIRIGCNNWLLSASLLTTGSWAHWLVKEQFQGNCFGGQHWRSRWASSASETITSLHRCRALASMAANWCLHCAPPNTPELVKHDRLFRREATTPACKATVDNWIKIRKIPHMSTTTERDHDMLCTLADYRSSKERNDLHTVDHFWKSRQKRKIGRNRNVLGNTSSCWDRSWIRQSPNNSSDVSFNWLLMLYILDTNDSKSSF